MRLRVKSASQPNVVWRVEAQEGFTLDKLQHAVATTCFAPEKVEELEREIRVSLNKRDQLVLQAGETIKDAGIRNGDVLWLLSPTNFPSECQPSDLNRYENVNSDVDPVDAVNNDKNPAREAYLTEAPKYGRIPMHLHRVLCSSPISFTTAPEVLLLTLHAAMLETGFVLSVIKKTDIKDSESSSDAHALPASVGAAIKRGTCILVYTYNAQLSSEQQPTCTVVCSVMGRDVLIAINNRGQPSHHVSLDCGTYFMQRHQEIHGAHVERMICGHVGFTDNKELSIAGGSVTITPEAICLLWTRLKNEMTLPALADVCRVAGLPPPAGLQTMTIDIKMKIFDYLDACDLASVSATCTELHHLADNDQLWERLCNAQFPKGCSNFSDIIKSKAQKNGWKWVYGQCFKDRQRRMEEENNLRRRRPVAMIPSFGPAYPPFYPAPPHPGFSAGIIGGEQDRLPFLGGSGLAGSRAWPFPGTRPGREHHRWF